MRRARAGYWHDAMEETLDWLYGEAAHEDERARSADAQFSEREITLMMETLLPVSDVTPRPDDLAGGERSQEWNADSMDSEPLAQAILPGSCADSGRNGRPLAAGRTRCNWRSPPYADPAKRQGSPDGCERPVIAG